MEIIGIMLLIVGLILFFVKKNQSHKGFSVKSARSSTVKELEATAHSITQEIGGGSWRDYIKLWGTITSEQPLISELKQEPCVYYTMNVTREYEETTRKQDSEGKWIEETVKNSEIVASNQRQIPFMLQDATGKIVVNPEDGAIDTVKVLDEFRPGEAQAGMITFGNFSLVLRSTNHSQRHTLGYHYTESILPIGRDVLVVGEVSDETGKLTLAKPIQGNQRFILSLKTEQALHAAIAQTETNLSYAIIGCLSTGMIAILLGIIF